MPISIASFHRDLLDLELLMDHGWIHGYGNAETMAVQLRVASEGSSGTPVPDLSIKVDDLDAILMRVHRAGIAIEYGPTEEPWGVRRFRLRDPTRKLLNILRTRIKMRALTRIYSLSAICVQASFARPSWHLRQNICRVGWMATSSMATSSGRWIA